MPDNKIEHYYNINMNDCYLVQPVAYNVIYKPNGMRFDDDPPSCLSEQYDRIDNENDLIAYLRSELELDNNTGELKWDDSGLGCYYFVWENDKYLKSLKLFVYKRAKFA